MRVHLILPLVMLAGCAWDPGEGFAVIEPTVRTAYVSESGRDAGGGYQRLASDYQVRISTATMRLENIQLIATSGGGGGSGTFDPAHPPPGYTLCHSGHCHRDDGALIPYEEVAAEQGGGGATASPVTTLSVGDQDLLAPETRSLSCEPTCELPQTQVSRGRWAVNALRLEGTVRDGRASPRFPGERPFQLVLTATDAATPAVVLNGPLDVPADRAHAPRILLGLQLDLTAKVIDTVDWAATSPGLDGTVDLTATANASARTALLEQLAAQSPTAEIKREDR